MLDKRVRRLPVMKHDLLAGIITLGDIRGAEPSGATSLSIWEVNYLLRQLKIEEIMTRTLLIISPNATISQAAEMMLEHKVSGLPVVDPDKRLVGIVTESDIFRLVVQAWRQVEGVDPMPQVAGCLQ
jgi:acetoin utilization protein AcuB